MDRRFSVLRALPETTALDRANDVLALTAEGHRHLVRAHSAHCLNDWSGYLAATEAVNRCLVGIRDTARRWAAEVAEAPEVNPDQLALWTRPDRAVIHRGVAAA